MFNTNQQMVRALLRLSLFALCSIGLATAQTAATDPMTPSQQQRADLLYTKFVAPCCWRQSVAVHQSAEAIHVRHLIDDAIRQKQSDSEIKQQLIKEYGHGILIEPEGIRAILVYTAPVLASLVGLMFVVRWIVHRAPAQLSSSETSL